MIQAQEIELKKLSVNKGQIEGVPTNPRKASKEQIEKLKRSIEETPLMLEVNEMTAYDNNGELVVIRGNLRYKALKALGYKTAPVKVLPTETSKETVNQIVIKDNIHYGEWDTDCLQTEWEKGQLQDWGVEVSWGEDCYYHLRLGERIADYVRILQHIVSMWRTTALRLFGKTQQL